MVCVPLVSVSSSWVPLSVIDFAARSRLSEAYVAAAEGVGIKRNDDYNGAEQEGVGYYQNTMKNGRRWSAHRAFLKPAMKRANSGWSRA